MSLPNRGVVLGILLSAVCGGTLVGLAPGYVSEAFADEAPAGFDTSKLVKFDDRYYDIDYEPWVSTDPLSNARVKKIEAGRVTYVDIATTATGTYSSDGLTSRHVLYPGIEVEEVRRPGSAWFSYWTSGKWTRVSIVRGNSFVSIRNGNVRVGVWN